MAAVNNIARQVGGAIGVALIGGLATVGAALAVAGAALICGGSLVLLAPFDSGGAGEGARGSSPGGARRARSS